MSNYDRGVKHPKLKSCKVVIPNVFGTRDQFVEDKFSTDQRRSDGFGVIQFHYIYCNQNVELIRGKAEDKINSLPPEGDLT